jgi:hypothetical protein
MLDRLFKHPFALARHRTGPLVEERVAFLTHLASQGYTRWSLRKKARDLLAIARTLELTGQPRKAMTLAVVESKLANQCGLLPLAVRWFQFMGHLQQRPAPLTRCERKVKAFADYMAHEKGFRPDTIRRRCGVVTQFLKHEDFKSGSLHKITPGQIDVAIQKMLDAARHLRSSGWGGVLPATG